ncbi:AAA family ATPase [Streptomyces sp. NPDC000618]|uniref:AAA family ATPase n=1 Tax=Streptomyces sp. NPDC000618 TaxID=3154265 RepID=UPI003322C8BF
MAEWFVYPDDKALLDKRTTPENSFRAIGPAVRAAQAGDVIIVAPGIYTERINLDRSVTLRSYESGAAKLRSTSGAVYVSPGVAAQLSGFFFSGPALPIQVDRNAKLIMEDCDVKTYQTKGMTIEGVAELRDCRISDCTTGIITKGGSITLDRCLFTNIQMCGIFSTDSSVSVQRSHFTHCGDNAINASSGEMHISNCVMEEANKNAIWASDVSGEVADCRLRQCAHNGVDIQRALAVEIVGCAVEEVGKNGLWASGELKLRDSQFTRCKQNGINLTDVSAEVVDCKVEEATNGLWGSGNLKVKGSRFTHCSENGVQLDSGRAELVACDIQNAGYNGIWANSEFTLRETNIATCKMRGIIASGGPIDFKGSEVCDTTKDGIYIYRCSDLKLEGIKIRHCGTGLFLASGNAVIRNCEVRDSIESGIVVETDEPVHISGCTVTGSSKSDLLGADRPGVRLTQNVGLIPAAVGESFGVKAEAEGVSALAELEDLIGLRGVKTAVHELVTEMRHSQWEQSMAAHTGKHTKPPELQHLIFEGPPGTGKTTVARLYARIAAEIGAVEYGQLVEVSRDTLVGDVIGATEKLTASAFNKAKGGVLFIDEAYALVPADASDRDFGKQAIDTLVKLMDDHRNQVIVIAAGYRSEMERWKQSNPGLPGRFSQTIIFPNYSPAELIEVTAKIARDHGYTLADDAAGRLTAHFQRQERGETFSNARAARNVFEAMRRQLAGRVMADIDAGRQPTDPYVLRADDMGPSAGDARLVMGSGKEDSSQLASILDRLDGMIGLRNVKETINTIINEISNQKVAGMPTEPIGHLVFMGPPGTGKTTVARLFGQLLSALGMLGEGKFLEVSKRDLVAGYVGQTPEKTSRVFDRAKGGVLFIDEAYELARSDGGNEFGREAIDTLVKLMEDHRDEVVVIAAGYTDEMNRFLKSNKGLRERFTEEIEFPSYSPEELGQLAEILANERGFICPQEALAVLVERYSHHPRDESFGNARHVRNTIKKMIGIHANYIAQAGDAVTQEDRRTFRAEDVPNPLPNG